MTNILFLCIIILLFFFCLYFFFENEKLKKKILELELENKEVLEKRLSKIENLDQVSIQKISAEKEPSKPKEQVLQEKKATSPKTKLSESDKAISKEPSSSKVTSNKPSSQIKESTSNNIQKKNAIDSRFYQKNVHSSHSSVTSPVSITNQDTYSKEDAFDMNKLTLDLNEFIKKSEKVVPKIKEKPTKPDYLKEISEKMANELKPQTIELTDYEKAQEEHAIISYKELLAVKDKLNIIDDDEETIDFIEELKYLRNGLKTKK